MSFLKSHKIKAFISFYRFLKIATIRVKFACNLMFSVFTIKMLPISFVSIMNMQKAGEASKRKPKISILCLLYSMSPVIRDV